MVKFFSIVNGDLMMKKFIVSIVGLYTLLLFSTSVIAGPTGTWKNVEVVAMGGDVIKSGKAIRKGCAMFHLLASAYRGKMDANMAGTLKI